MSPAVALHGRALLCSPLLHHGPWSPSWPREQEPIQPGAVACRPPPGGCPVAEGPGSAAAVRPQPLCYKRGWAGAGSGAGRARAPHMATTAMGTPGCCCCSPWSCSCLVVLHPGREGQPWGRVRPCRAVLSRVHTDRVGAEGLQPWRCHRCGALGMAKGLLFCCAFWCSAVPCRAAPLRAVLCHTLLCHTVLCHPWGTACRAVCFYHAMVCRPVTPQHAVFVLLRPAVPCHCAMSMTREAASSGCAVPGGSVGHLLLQ